MNCEQVLYIRIIEKVIKKCLQSNARMILYECKKKEGNKKKRY